MTNSDDVKTLIVKMDRLTRVIAIDAVKDKPPAEKVSILNALDFSQTEIAEATGMSQGNVSKILKKLRIPASPRKVEESDKE